jgi:hypothetical protein
MASAATWLKDILPQTPGVSRKVAKREFQLVCREFFEKSTAWRVVMGPLDVDANDADYTLSPYDSNTNITKILAAEFNGVGLRPLFRRPAGVYEEATTPYAYFITEPDTIHLWPKPTEAHEDALTVYVALTTTVSTTTLPDVAETLFYEPLRDGLLGKLFSHPAKPYTNPLQAQYHLSRYESAIGAYAGRAKAGNGPSWTFPMFGK